MGLYMYIRYTQSHTWVCAIYVCVYIYIRNRYSNTQCKWDAGGAKGTVLCGGTWKQTE